MPADTASSLALGVEALLGIAPFVAIAVLNLVFVRRGWTPLTQLVESYLRRYPLFAAGLCGFLGALVGHVFWSSGDNPPAPPASPRLLLLAVAAAVAGGALSAVVLVALASLLRWLRPAWFEER